MTKKTKRRIRKAVMFARGFLLIAAIILLCVAGMLVGNGSFMAAVIVAISAVICAAMSLFCDYLLGGYKSPFYY